MTHAGWVTNNAKKADAKTEEAITALRQALEQPVQEPVAWASKRTLDCIKDFDGTIYANGGFDDAVPLYTAPRQALEQPGRKWVGLTDEEEIELDEKYGDDFNAYIDARDAKLKEKNRV